MHYRMQALAAVVPWKYLQRLEYPITHVLALQRAAGSRPGAGPPLLGTASIEAQ